MLLVLRPFLDPAAQDVDLSCGDLLVRLRRRHEFVFIMREDALEHAAGLGLAGFDRKGSFDGGEGTFGRVEPEIALAFFRVEAVAGEAVVAEDGADVAIEVHLACGGG